MRVPIRILVIGVAFSGSVSGGVPQYDRLLANPRIRAAFEWPDAAGASVDTITQQGCASFSAESPVTFPIAYGAQPR